MAVHVIFPASAGTLRLLENFADRNGIVRMHDDHTVAIELLSNRYVFRMTMPNAGNSVHVSVGVAGVALNHSVIFSELQKVSDAYVAAIFFA